MSTATGGANARQVVLLAEQKHQRAVDGTLLGARPGGYYNDQLSEEEVAVVIASYKPHLPTTQWLKIADFVRACVTDVKVVAAGSHVREHMKLTSRLTLWATTTASLELDREEIFDPSTITRFVQLLRDASPKNQHKRTLSLLIGMSESLIGTKRTEFRPRVYGRTSADPYPASDLGWILGWAAGQGAVQRKRAADALVGFCLGAGARSSEMATARCATSSSTALAYPSTSAVRSLAPFPSTRSLPTTLARPFGVSTVTPT